MFNLCLIRLKQPLRTSKWAYRLVKLSSSQSICRGIHSSAIKQNDDSPLKSVNKGPTKGIKISEPPITRFTIHVRSSKTVSPEQLSKKISEEYLRKVGSDARNPNYKGNWGVVILATPSFATWLEADAGFIPKVLESLDLQSSAAVISACVDGLAEGSKSVHSPGAEGFSVLCGPVNAILPEYITEGFRKPQEAGSKNPSVLSSLTFNLKHDARAVLPLSNTLFKTGRHSTLLYSEWTRTPGRFVKYRDQIEKANVHVKGYLHETGSRRLFNLRLPVVRLTPTRRIVDGLGNIVRKLDFGEDGKEEIGSASRELEAAVTEYLKTSDGKSVVEVWAMINSPVKGVPPTLYGVYERQKPMDLGTIIKGKTNIRICRVLSGGGGWGPKEGLLSLDPQTSYDVPSEARFDFSSGTMEEAQASALGKIVQKGGSIQFFAAIHPSTDNPIPKCDRKMILKFGAVPSKVDELEQQSESGLTKADEEDNLSFIWDEFGCVSESGMYLQYKGFQSKKWEGNGTKIDLPYAYVGRYANLLSEETTPS